jgi:hypothetical protein
MNKTIKAGTGDARRARSELRLTMGARAGALSLCFKGAADSRRCCPRRQSRFASSPSFCSISMGRCGQRLLHQRKLVFPRVKAPSGPLSGPLALRSPSSSDDRQPRPRWNCGAAVDTSAARSCRFGSEDGRSIFHLLNRFQRRQARPRRPRWAPCSRTALASTPYWQNASSPPAWGLFDRSQ